MHVIRTSVATFPEAPFKKFYPLIYLSSSRSHINDNLLLINNAQQQHWQCFVISHWNLMTLCFLHAASLAQNDLPLIFCLWQTSSSWKPLKNELFLLLYPSIKLLLLLLNTYFTLSQIICICFSSLASKALERLSPVNTCKPLCWEHICLPHGKWTWSVYWNETGFYGLG